MSEVKRFRADHRHVVETEFDDSQFVGVADYDAAQSELAALREELATMTSAANGVRDAWREDQQRLTAAEQRNATLVSLLQRVVDSSVLSFEQDAPEDLESLEADICAALAKPTESGASEYVQSCKVAHEALKMERQRIEPARFKCLACGDYHEGSGNLPCPKMRPMSVVSV